MRADSVGDLYRWNPPPIIPIIEEIMFPQNKVFIYGRYKSWKSMLAMHTGYCLAQGTPWFGFNTTKSVVLVVQCEIQKYQYKIRSDKYADGNQLSDKLAKRIACEENLHIASEPYIKLDQGFGYQALEAEIYRLHPTVIIIDPLYKVVSGRLSDEWEMRKFTDRVDMLIDKHKVSVIIIHHDRKEQIQEGQVMNRGSQEMYGTVFFQGWCDSSVRLEVQDGNENEVDVIPDILRNAQQDIKPFRVAIDKKTLQFRIKPKDNLT
jgi:hypothetical protein